MSENLKRMIALADSFFDVRHDPEQLQVDQHVLEKLSTIDPNTLSEEIDGDGPVVWILLIPTTSEVMHRFLKNEITENQLFEETEPGQNYDALYLCSALVLEEFRHKGLAKKLSLQAIEEIRKKYPIQYLYVWAFSEEGKQLSKRLSDATGLPLLSREDSLD